MIQQTLNVLKIYGDSDFNTGDSFPHTCWNQGSNVSIGWKFWCKGGIDAFFINNGLQDTAN